MSVNDMLVSSHLCSRWCMWVCVLHNVFVYSHSMAAEEQTQGLRLAVLAANVLTECMPMKCLFARHQSALLAPLPSMEIHRAKQCHNASPSAWHRRSLTHRYEHNQTCIRHTVGVAWVRQVALSLNGSSDMKQLWCIREKMHQLACTKCSVH